MTHAYQEIYVSKAQRVLGDAFDFAINVCNVPGEDFVKLFLGSSVSKRIEKGDPGCVAGKSGAELVLEIIEETTFEAIDATAVESIERSREYWIGWAVAYYQWYSDRKFSEIFQVVTFEDLQNAYYALHEADVSKFVDVIDEKVKEVFNETNLKRIRSTYGCTQAELASKSGVSLRSIQMYEQRRKDINKASVETLYRISKILGCEVEDLIEKQRKYLPSLTVD